jgi:uncharacterized membrane protein
MRERIRFFFNRFREHLWVKPLIICLISIAIAFVAKLADRVTFLQTVPEVRLESLNTLLSITSGSMLGVATFAVGSMLTAYSSATNTATPRSFPLIIADDVSQNTLSSFIGALIFSVVAKVALENGYYGQAGRFLLFLISAAVFGLIIFYFIRWLDRIARLGRLGNVIDKVEDVTQKALLRRKAHPTMGGVKAVDQPGGIPVYGRKIGYLQRIDVLTLQNFAEENDIEIRVAALPGKFLTPDIPLAFCNTNKNSLDALDFSEILNAFTMNDDRTMDEDPRFGLIILSEIGSRALSAAVNDPGTAIDIIESFVRLFARWVEDDQKDAKQKISADRVFVPELSIKDMLDDAFNAISRDGAGTLEVAVWLQKAFKALAALGDEDLCQEAVAHANLAYRYAEKALVLPEEIEILQKHHQFVDSY